MKRTMPKPRREPEPTPPPRPFEEPAGSRTPPPPFDEDQPTPARPLPAIRPVDDDEPRDRRRAS
jgi:hypothetical protein